MPKRFRPVSLPMLILGFGLGAARADEDATVLDAITPYRPTVSNPAQLPVPGQLELELGGVRSRSPGTRRSSVPYLLKLGFNAEWGVLLGGDARVWLHDESGRAQGIGDTSLTLKHAWILDEATAFGAELTAKLPTAGDRIGSGRADYSLNTIFSLDLGSQHLDVNLNGTRLGAPDLGSARASLGASAAVSTPISDHWGATGELSGNHQGGQAGNSAQLLAALTWSPSKRLTFDFGVARAWRPAPGTTQVFGGVVLPLATLW